VHTFSVLFDSNIAVKSVQIASIPPVAFKSNERFRLKSLVYPEWSIKRPVMKHLHQISKKNNNRVQLNSLNDRNKYTDQLCPIPARMRLSRSFFAAQWSFHYCVCTVEWQHVFILIILNLTFCNGSKVPVYHVLLIGRFPRVHWHLGAKVTSSFLIATHVFFCTGTNL